MIRRTLPGITVVALSLAACGRAPDVTAIETPAATIVQPLFGTLYSDVREPRRMLIRDEQSWSEVWPQLVGSSGPATSAPRVDFTSEDVVVAAMGERRTAGYGIAITGVREANGSLQVTVTSTLPNPGCSGADVVTAPVVATRVTKASAAVAFEERAILLPCN
ncbi:MAG: protease complex subunit PrcB family protein [Gemmatimonadota bacterium]